MAALLKVHFISKKTLSLGVSGEACGTRWIRDWKHNGCDGSSWSLMFYDAKLLWVNMTITSDAKFLLIGWQVVGLRDLEKSLENYHIWFLFLLSVYHMLHWRRLKSSFLGRLLGWWETLLWVVSSFISPLSKEVVLGGFDSTFSVKSFIFDTLGLQSFSF